MTYSVLPMLDMNRVTVLPVAVRPSWNHQLGSFSHSEYVSSGPLRRKPSPTMTAKRTKHGQDGPHGEVLQGGGEGRAALVLPRSA